VPVDGYNAVDGEITGVFELVFNGFLVTGSTIGKNTRLATGAIPIGRLALVTAVLSAKGFPEIKDAPVVLGATTCYPFFLVNTYFLYDDESYVFGDVYMLFCLYVVFLR
jgi:hypothetical protein